MLIHKAAKDIIETDLSALIAAEVREGKQIEYKEKLDLGLADHKRKLLRATVSFANASGGDLILGIRAEDGVPKELLPLPGFNPDADTLRMRDLIRAHIDPPMFGVEFKDVQVKTGHALVVRVPRSWQGPHMVTYDGEDHFYARDQNGCVRMNVPEIRAAFTLTEALAERIRRFRAERLGAIRAGESAVDLEPGPKLVLHVLPFRSFEPGFRCNLEAILQGHNFRPMLIASGWDSTHDVEGFYAFERRASDASSGYSLAFRTGCIEVVQNFSSSARTKKIISNPGFEARLIGFFPQCVQWLKAAEADAPISVALSLLDVRDFVLYFHETQEPHFLRRIRQRDLVIPAVLIESFEQPVATMFRPIFDSIWNACGLERSLNYDTSGKFRPQPEA